ncbi:baseplate J/gp47 family protein [Sporosarcina sp. P17b]|uniref:baseplate J/gp47 family protein n=1 Tax=Sporosarcina sp. P17b TaxID=2048260 RepID=UPI000C168998|nr:baseplate J/gp47 family protein [Sporosarcina sp. P17b]PIC72438.1 baseplate J protein [Sporosarcina sp. P17b]
MNRSPEQITADMLNHISNTEDKSENSFVHDPLSAAATEFFTAYRNVEYIGGKIDIENLEGGELERFIYQRTGLTRRLSTFAEGKVVISGEAGTVIEEGALVSAGDVEFAVTESKTLDETGRATVNVKATIDGSIGNVPVNAINDFPTSVVGVVDVYNPYEITNGYDEENDETFLGRYYEKLQRPAKSGNKYHYEQWAKEVAGVGGVKVIPRWNGLLTVKVIIVDSVGLPAGVDLVNATAAYIEKERPFGATVTVVSATSKPIDISATITLVEGYEVVEVKSRIASNVSGYLQSVAFKASYISYAKIGSIILETDGVLDYENLLVNLGTGNVPVGNEEVAVIGGVS